MGDPKLKVIYYGGYDDIQRMERATMKLHEATDEQKLRKLAELDGWTMALQKDNVFGVAFRMRDAFNKPIWEDTIPNYLTSYDAIIPLIQKLEFEATVEAKGYLLTGIPVSIELTPRQLADALLIATNSFEL